MQKVGRVWCVCMCSLILDIVCVSEYMPALCKLLCLQFLLTLFFFSCFKAFDCHELTTVPYSISELINSVIGSLLLLPEPPMAHLNNVREAVPIIDLLKRIDRYIFLCVCMCVVVVRDFLCVCVRVVCCMSCPCTNMWWAKFPSTSYDLMIFCVHAWWACCVLSRPCTTSDAKTLHPHIYCHCLELNL